LTEVRETHFGEGRAAARAKAIEALTAVALPNPARALDKHPHELSGGQRQRAAIAMALLAEPALLVADEPTAALDPVVQRQILGLLLRLRQSRGLSLAVVSHDLGAHAGLTDRVAVVYAGRVVEEGPAGDLLSRACHPYTRALVAAAAGIEGPRRPRLDAVPGSPPRPGEIARGCAFAPRCPRAVPRCQEESPPETILGDRRFRCFEPWT
jgi:oligopeptide/dipeptide ABC transporter ATP-binding protein